MEARQKNYSKGRISMKRAVILLLISAIAAVIPIQLVSAGPLSREQLDAYKSGIEYFDIVEVIPNTNPGGGGGYPGDPNNPPSPGDSGNASPIDTNSSLSSIAQQILSAGGSSQSGSCVNLPSWFLRTYAPNITRPGSYNGGTAAERIANANSGKGLFTTNNASIVPSSGISIGIWSTYATGWASLTIDQDGCCLGGGYDPVTRRYGHAGIVIVKNDGSATALDGWQSGVSNHHNVSSYSSFPSGQMRFFMISGEYLNIK
jgi:hypothetical protein